MTRISIAVAGVVSKRRLRGPPRLGYSRPARNQVVLRSQAAKVEGAAPDATHLATAARAHLLGATTCGRVRMTPPRFCLGDQSNSGRRWGLGVRWGGVWVRKPLSLGLFMIICQFRSSQLPENACRRTGRRMDGVTRGCQGDSGTQHRAALAVCEAAFRRRNTPSGV